MAAAASWADAAATTVGAGPFASLLVSELLALGRLWCGPSLLGLLVAAAALLPLATVACFVES